MNFDAFFTATPRYPVELDNGYQILKPLDMFATGSVALRMHDPWNDTVVTEHVAYSALLSGKSVALATAVHSMLARVLHRMIAELDVMSWVSRAYRRMPRKWRVALLAELQNERSWS